MNEYQNSDQINSQSPTSLGLESTAKAQSQEPNQQDQALCKKLMEWNHSVEKFWADDFKIMKANREYLSGKMGYEDDKSGAVRANLCFSTLHALLPHIYARNPDISVFPSEGVSQDQIQAIKSLSHSLETAIDRAFIEKTNLKPIAKRCIRGALTTKIAWTKLVYQRDYFNDPVTVNRIEDEQDNIARLEEKIQSLTDPLERVDDEAELLRLKNMVEGLQREIEVPVRQGLSLQRIMPEHLLVDPAIMEIGDILQARRLTHVIPIPMSKAKARFPGVDLSSATTYTWEEMHIEKGESNRAGSTIVKSGTQGVEDPIVKVYELWDKDDYTVYTMIDGVKEFVKEPMQPESQPERWYPFFPLSFYDVDGQFLGLDLITLIRELTDEYNSIRTQQAEHREVSIPTWIADKTTEQDSLERHKDATLGEIVIVDAGGRPISDVITAAQNPPYNPAIYDTSPILRDVDMMSGLPDAQRSSIGRSKTLGEAELLNEGLETRTAEMRDNIEAWINDMAIAACEILLQEWTPDQIVKYIGPEAFQSWPMALSKEQVFDKISISIRSGTSGKPNQLKEKQQWAEIMPVINQIQTQILQMSAQGIDVSHIIETLKETVSRMDDTIDVDRFIPSLAKQTNPLGNQIGPQQGDLQQGAEQPQPEIQQILNSITGN